VPEKRKQLASADPSENYSTTNVVIDFLFSVLEMEQKERFKE
jgi:hypothetical protein